MPSLKTIVRVAIRDPQPLVRWVRSRTVAKVDSMGLVVRKCGQCWEHFFIFLQALAGFWEFDLVTGDELAVGCQSGFASRSQVHFMDQLLRFALNAFRPFIQDIGGTLLVLVKIPVAINTFSAVHLLFVN
jgi:hypothetical protein